MKNAFVTSLGSVAADIVIKTLKRNGFNVIGCDIYPQSWVVDSNNVNVFYQCPYTSESEKYLNFVKEVCKKHDVNFILPLTDVDVDLFNKNREWFDTNNIVICISPEETLDICRNKKVLADFVMNNCTWIKYIPTKFLKDIETLEWEFPVVCKPFNGRSSQGLRYIYNETEWNEFIKTADKESYIVEPFIKGPIVMVEIVRQLEMNKCVAVPRQEILSTPNGCATTVRMFHDEKLEQESIDLANKLNIKGCINFEYIRDENEVYHLVECNPRFSAGAEFTCISGYDCVSNHIRCFENKAIDDFHFTKPRYIARKWEEFVTLIEE